TLVFGRLPWSREWLCKSPPSARAARGRVGRWCRLRGHPRNCRNPAGNEGHEHIFDCPRARGSHMPSHGSPPRIRTNETDEPVHTVAHPIMSQLRLRSCCSAANPAGRHRPWLIGNPPGRGPRLAPTEHSLHLRVHDRCLSRTPKSSWHRSLDHPTAAEQVPHLAWPAASPHAAAALTSACLGLVLGRELLRVHDPLLPRRLAHSRLQIDRMSWG